jgi:hypothetical protein
MKRLCNQQWKRRLKKLHRKWRLKLTHRQPKRLPKMMVLLPLPKADQTQD